MIISILIHFCNELSLGWAAGIVAAKHKRRFGSSSSCWKLRWYIISINLTYLGPIWNYKFSHFLFTKASFLCFITLVVALGCLLECSWCWKSPDWINKFFSLFKTNIIFAFLPKIPQSYSRITSLWAPCCKRKYTCHIIPVNGGASFRWSFGPLSAWGSIESTTIIATHPSLLFAIWKFW